MSKIRLIIINSVLYSLSTVVSKTLSFFLLPVFTYYLSKEDYGILGIITAITTFVNTYIGLNPSLFIMVKGSKQGKSHLANYIYNILLLTGISFSAVLLIIIAFKNFIFPEEVSGNIWIILMIGIYSLSNTNIRILDTVFQLEKKAFQSSLLQSIQSLVSLGIASLLIIRFSFHWEGLYFSDFIITVLLSGYSLYILHKKGYISIGYDYTKLKEILQYLFPLTFHVLGFVIIGSADKFFISKFLSLQEVGIYSISCTVSMVIGMMHDSLLKAWSPFFFEEIHHNDGLAHIKIVKLIYLYGICSLFIAGVFVLISPYIFKIMIDEKFKNALMLVPFLSLGYTLLGIRNTIVGYLYLTGKTMIIATLSLLTGCINIILNYLLIQYHGLKGAAEAMLFSYIILFFLTLYFANRSTKIPWLLRQV